MKRATNRCRECTGYFHERGVTRIAHESLTGVSMNIIKPIKSYYPLALAEREGAGTAYEYFVKAGVISAFLKKRQAPVKTVLLGGLPERYGFSFDFVLLSQMLQAKLKVVDDRRERLDEFRSIFRELAAGGHIQDQTVEIEAVSDLTNFSQPEKADLFISCEVLQRLENQSGYLKSAADCAEDLFFFAPNARNAAHAGLSGLKTVGLETMRNLLTETGRPVGSSGYIDMPPFPPGITRSEDQREKAQQGLVEQAAFMVFEWWANLERFFPKSIRENKSHIVYVST